MDEKAKAEQHSRTASLVLQMHCIIYCIRLLSCTSVALLSRSITFTWTVRGNNRHKNSPRLILV